MKSINIILASILLSASAQAAVTINLSGNPTTGPVWTVPAGGLVKDGGVVLLGTFSAEPAKNSSFAELAASFVEFGRSTVGTDNVNGANTGHIQRSNIAGIDGGTSPQADSFFATKEVYIWVYDAAAVNDTAAQGIFKTATTFQDQATAVSVSMSSFVNAYGMLEGGTPATATLAPGGATATGYVLSAAVPEPSVGLLSVLGLGLLIKRRR